MTKWLVGKRYAPYLVMALTFFWIAGIPVVAIFPLLSETLTTILIIWFAIALVVNLRWSFLSEGIRRLPEGYRVELTRYKPNPKTWDWQINTGNEILHEFDENGYEYNIGHASHLLAIVSAGYWIHDKIRKEAKKKKREEIKTKELAAREEERIPIYMKGYTEVYDPKYVERLEEELEIANEIA